MEFVSVSNGHVRGVRGRDYRWSVYGVWNFRVWKKGDYSKQRKQFGFILRFGMKIINLTVKIPCRAAEVFDPVLSVVWNPQQGVIYR